MRTLLILVALVALSGCDTTTPTTSSRSKKSTSPDGVASYAFHRNAALSDIKKTLPDGSVDYVDFDMADNPNVLVVVTASAPPRDGLTFTTSFSGPGNLRIEKKWTPKTSAGDDEHVGIFVLPKSIKYGRTSRTRTTKKVSFDESTILFH